MGMEHGLISVASNLIRYGNGTQNSPSHLAKFSKYLHAQQSADMKTWNAFMPPTTMYIEMQDNSMSPYAD